MMVERFRELGGLRETPKFFIVRLLGHLPRGACWLPVKNWSKPGR